MSQPVYHLRATLLPDGDAPRDLWIVDGRISFVPQYHAETIGPPGGYVLPGLVDCHVHLTVDFSRIGLPVGSAELVEAARQRHLASGTLLLRDIGSVSNATLHLPTGDGLPRVHAAGRYLAPADGYGGTQQPTEPGQLAHAAEAQVRAGVRWVKVIGDWPRLEEAGGLPALQHGESNYPPEVLAAAVSLARSSGARVAVHALKRDAIAAAITAGVDSIEHGLELDDELLAQMAERGIAWTPTLASFQATRRSAERRGQMGLGSWLDDCFERLRVLLPRAQRLGVPILAGTDVLPAGSVVREVAALRQSGLTPREALAAASTSARAYLGERGIEEGAAAELVAFASDPRGSPELLERPDLIVFGGRPVVLPAE